MIESDDILKLEDYDEEDIGDIIVKLGKSFRIRFDKDAFKNVYTFGQLCDVFEANINRNHSEDCTKQQAFYKIRKAISLSQPSDKKQITPDTKLADIFPLQNRRKQTKEFRKQLGIKVNFLTYPNWLTLLFIAGFLASFITLFFNWKMAVTGITVFILSSIVARYFGRNLQVETVRKLAEKATREHYMDSRRFKLTINRNEITDVIRDVFSHDLWIDKKHLTREAMFSWAKAK